ncbi:3-hydroxyacyl-CoA dehydrogenase [Ideonella sp. 4Y16]|uniref:3-hydroxyacyl-CoA dehydrogenase n=1 Tax=Ideonella alba TaxID=2824118 RepID=UPI001B360C38|nr:3-hydroxyacyl-CoA dehydrogenase [Ideonella alba]MBQ0944417.1 3-hydroxyacyl-CoA dehydrogenase [Ideonella alba]
MTDLTNAPVLVVGAGIMGAGIAQVAAQAGHRVWLHDTREGAAASAKTALAKTLQGLVDKGKLGADAAEGALARITPISALAEAAAARVVVEAIVENLEVKRGLFRDLEALLADDAILATNTSSISVTAIANGLRRPGRLVGMHFFNPVPLMKLVEVVSGLHTEPPVAEAIFTLSKAWGKVPVHAKSSPGFIVNRIARPYYAETLALLQEQAATPAVLDACLRGAAFRMGPCELMDLIGHDTNFAVTNSVYGAYFQDKRFGPSGVQRDLVDAGWLGRKNGRGFYTYPQTDADKALPAAPQAAPGALTVHGQCAWAARIADALSAAGLSVTRDTTAAAVAISLAEGGELRPTDGRPASQLAFEGGARDVAVFDWSVTETVAPGTPIAFAVASGASDAFSARAAGVLAAAGWQPLRVADAAGLVVARTIAMLVNEAADAVQQGVCSPEGADAAMKLGVNYPAGPFEWLARVGAPAVVGLLDRLDTHYRGERYRVSPWLRQRVWATA